MTDKDIMFMMYQKCQELAEGHDVHENPLELRIYVKGAGNIGYLERVGMSGVVFRAVMSWNSFADAEQKLR